MSIEPIGPDLQAMRKYALKYLRRYITNIDHGDVLDEMLCDERFAHLMTGDEDRDVATLDPIAAEITAQAKVLAGTLSWPDEQPQDHQCAWHGLRLFSGPALFDEGDVDQHEITHPEQCSTLPPGAACWAEHQPFRWWWPTAHGTYRIRPEDLLTGGSENGPDYETTLRVQVLKDGEWFEYSNEIIGADPTDETPKILERLKAGLAEKAAVDTAARVDRDSNVQTAARVVWMYGTAEHSSEHAYTTIEAAQMEAIWEYDPTLAEEPEYWSWEPCPPQPGRLAMLCGDDRTGYTVYPVTVAPDAALEARDAKAAEQR